MSPRLNAVSNFASVRDTAEVSADGARNLRSNANRDSFSQILRGTTDEQSSSGTKESRTSEKKEKKPSKDDSDTNTAAATTPAGNALPDKSSLPITFLLGFPTEQLESFDAQQGASSSASSSITVKAPSSNQLPQAKLSALIAHSADTDGDETLAMMQLPVFANATLPNGQDSQKPDAGVANAKGLDLLPVGESGNSAKGAAGILSPNTLAFAMRLGSGQALSTSKIANTAPAVAPVVSDGIQTNFAAATHSAIQAASGSVLEENAHEHSDESGQAQNVADFSGVRTSEPFDTTKIAEENVPTSGAQAPADPSATATTEPVRNVHMQLVSDDNRRVDVRLIDRGGELHVSVKSADAALTQNLQDHLPDLTARLDKQHMQTEVWIPKTSEPTKAEGGNTNGSLSDSNTGSYSSNSEDRKDGRQQRKPDWVDALESYS